MDLPPAQADLAGSWRVNLIDNSSFALSFADMCCIHFTIWIGSLE